MLKESKHYRFKGLEYWAQGGMVTILDVEMAGDSDADATEAVIRVTPGEFIKRAIAVRMSCTDQYSDERVESQRLLERATEVSKAAKAQGDPSDPGVWEHVSRHARRSSIIMPGDPSIAAPVSDYKLKFTSESRGILRDGSYQVVPDLQIGQGQMLTPAKAELMRKRKKSGGGIRL